MQSTDKQNEIEPKKAHVMRILAIDTSASWVSVALLDGKKPILELDSRDSDAESDQFSPSSPKPESDIPAGFSRKRSKGKTKSKRIFPPGASILLMPMIKTLLSQTDSKIQEIGLVALTVGPGLFTGLRVGVVTAKSIAYSSGADLIGVNTLELLAIQAIKEGQENVIRPVINAQRQQVFAGHYKPVGELEVEELAAPEVMKHQAWVDSLQPDQVATGLGLKSIIKSNPEINRAPENVWETSAASAGRFAWHQHQSGVRHDFWKLSPQYFRPSAAEEVRLERLKKMEAKMETER